MNKVKWLSRDLIIGMKNIALKEKINLSLEETVNSLGDYINKYINSNKALSIKDIINKYIKLKQYLFIRSEREKSIRNFERVYKRIQELKDEKISAIKEMSMARTLIQLKDISDYKFSYSKNDETYWRRAEGLPLLCLDMDEITLMDYKANLLLMENLFILIYASKDKTYKEFIKENSQFFNNILPMCFIVLNLSRIEHSAKKCDTVEATTESILRLYNTSKDKYLACNYHF